MKQIDTGFLLSQKQEDKHLLESRQAEAYREEVVANAEGEAVRFDKLLAEYQKAPKVTRDRLYLDALQGLYSNSTKVLMDVEGGNNLMYLPLDKILEQNRSQEED
jgi:membrane protease subunit HflK